MPKLFRYLIIVWSVVCLSGLGIFLFQIYGPSIEPQTGYDTRDVAVAVAFFIFLWIIPVGVLAIAGRRHKE